MVRVDAQVANIIAAADTLHEAVTTTEDFVLAPDQLRDLQGAQLKIAAILYLEMGEEANEPQEGERDESSLTPDQEVARIEGDQDPSR